MRTLLFAVLIVPSVYSQTCLECLPGEYESSPCNSENNTVCTACPLNSTSPANSTSFSACTCEAAFIRKTPRLAGLELSQFTINNGNLAANGMDPRFIKNGVFRQTDADNGWSPINGWNPAGFLIIDMLHIKEMTGVITGGWIGAGGRYVSAFTIEYSDNNVDWQMYGSFSQTTVFATSHLFVPHITARYLKVTPTAVVNHLELLIDVYVEDGNYFTNSLCQACPSTGYCPDHGSYFACPDNTITSTPATAVSQCDSCKVGYIQSGDQSCRQCLPGHYCPNSTSELVCSTGSFSIEGSTRCTNCSANTYSDENGLSACKPCSSNSVGPAASNSKSNCNCNSGYYRDINMNCVLCPAGFRCTGNNMEACPKGYSSVLGSTTCTACPRGTYTDRNGLPSCLTCPAGLTVTKDSSVELYHECINRAEVPNVQNNLFIQRFHLPTTETKINITKWSFYATQTCTVTPVLLQSTNPVGFGGYQNPNMQVSKVGTTRTVNGAGKYTYDFLEGQKVESKQASLIAGTITYNNLEFLGWYFSGPACIPHEVSAGNANDLLNFVISLHPYDVNQSITTQIFANNIDLGAIKTTDIYSISLNYTVSTIEFATPAIASTTIFNCSCGSNLRTLSDGNCQGLCVDGMYMVNDTAETCSICPQGSYCTRSVKYNCPTQQSSLAQSGQCMACPGPDTHTDLSLAMCGLKTCPANTNLINLGATGWKGMGQITIGQGGNGVIPVTHWFSGYKCLGLVLNASVDRPVSLIQQTLTVVPGQTYAVRYKYVCTGSQCAANFKVTWLETNTVFSENNFVHRSWTEGTTPYFSTTSTSFTIQFRAQMVTSSCSIWLAQVELVNMGRWAYSSMSALQLKPGIELPVRLSASYVEGRSHILMQITGNNYIEQIAGVVTGHLYELMYWRSGTVNAWILNGTNWTQLTVLPAYETGVGYIQAVYQFIPTWSPVLIRFTGPGLMTNPSFKIFTELAGAPCKHCLNNFWCAGSTLNRCPLNTISAVGSLIQSDCYCAPGYYGNVGLDASTGYTPCAICPMNSYCNGGNQRDFCPPGTKSQPGSALSGCTPCVEGEFCANGLVGVCPANSYAPSGSDDLADCGCMPGYYGTMGNCSLCESGYYCPGGSTRQSCTANAVSPVGSVNESQCFCDRGFYGVNNSVCTPCQEGYWCWTGIRNLCPPNMWSPLQSSYMENCTCTFGYTGPDGGACIECSAGFYKSARGSQACTGCPTGTSSLATAAISSATCASCNRGSFNMYTGQSVCTLCDAGTATGNFGSTICSDCVAGTWSSQGAAVCTQCLAGTYSTDVGASSAIQCLACPTGAYSGPGSTSCQLCGACSYWVWPLRISLQFTLGSATRHSSVGANSGSMMTLMSATHALVNDVSDLFELNIQTGFVQSILYEKKYTTAITHLETSRNRDSIYMVQGGYAYRFSLPDISGMNAYGDEGIGAIGITESASGSVVWITCPTYMRSYNKDTESVITTVNYPTPFTTATVSPCVHSSYPNEIFFAGKSGLGLFGFRKYNTVTGVWSNITTEVSSLNKCTFSADGHFVFLTSSSNTWVWSMAENTLTRFYVGQVNGLVVDPSLNFVLMARQLNSVQRQTILIQDPRNCPTAQYSLNGGLQSSADCSTCPAGSLCPGGSNITQCSAGSYSQTVGLREQGQCAACPAGHYCTGGTSFQLCPLGSYSLATGVTRLVDCGRCPAGFYCPNTTVVIACPSNTNSPVGSSDLGQCTCDAGYKCEVSKVVHAEVTLPISIVDFEALRLQYRQAVAAAAGVSVDQVIIVSVTSSLGSGGMRRRLLADLDFTEVHTSIYESKYAAKPHLALQTLQTQLKMRGLPRHEKQVRITLHNEVRSSSKALAQR